MSLGVQRPFWIGVGSTGAIAVIVSASLGGVRGFEGISLGLAGSAFNLWALWAIIGLCGRMAGSPRSTRRGTIAILIAFFIKLPVFIALGILAHAIGGIAPTCFLVGIALVYSALVGWVLARG